MRRPTALRLTWAHPCLLADHTCRMRSSSFIHQCPGGRLLSRSTPSSPCLLVQHAAWSQLRLLYVNRENYWWGQQAQVQPASCWLDLMQAAVHSASLAPAAAPERLGRQPTPDSPHGLWLEFGVGSGKTTAAIAFQMKVMVGKEATLHGFDSFEGLPSDWDHTHLAAGTFSRGGKIPEHLLEMPNVKIHVGLFSDTLGDLDQFGDMPGPWHLHTSTSTFSHLRSRSSLG